MANKFFIFIFSLYTGAIAHAQITGLPKGSCARISGTLVRKINSNAYSVQLDNSPQLEDLVVLITIYSGGLGSPIKGIFESIGDEKYTFVSPSGKVFDRVLPAFKYSKQCGKKVNEKEAKKEQEGTKKSTFKR